MKKYTVIGSWTEIPNIEMGLTVFEIEGNHFEKVGNFFSEAKVGSCIYDDKRSVLYFVDEVQHPEERKIGGGGYVYAAYFDKDNGQISLLNRKKTLGVKPDFCCFDEERKHLIVVHHGSTRDTITRIKKNENGKYDNEVLYDDIPTVLFSLNDDGSIGEIMDVYLHDGINPSHDNPAHIHSVYRSPEGRFFVASDKGMDRIYSFRIDNSKLLVINVLNVEHESDPRYGVFNQKDSLFYGTNEKKPYLSVYRYTEESGITEKIRDVFLLDGTEDSSKKITASDVYLTSDERRLYVALRRVNRLIYLELDKEGIPELKQSIDIGGNNTRGLAVDEEENRLYCCNCESDLISVFKIDRNGYLERSDDSIRMNCPGNMLFIRNENK